MDIEEVFRYTNKYESLVLSEAYYLLMIALLIVDAHILTLRQLLAKIACSWMTIHQSFFVICVLALFDWALNDKIHSILSFPTRK